MGCKLHGSEHFTLKSLALEILSQNNSTVAERLEAEASRASASNERSA